jgi:hypothetical protein
MGKLTNRVTTEEKAAENPSMTLVEYRCPHCTDEGGRFGTILLYLPKRGNPRGLATGCSCNGQEQHCVVLMDLFHSYNLHSQFVEEDLIERLRPD